MSNRIKEKSKIRSFVTVDGNKIVILRFSIIKILIGIGVLLVSALYGLDILIFSPRPIGATPAIYSIICFSCFFWAARDFVPVVIRQIRDQGVVMYIVDGKLVYSGGENFSVNISEISDIRVIRNKITGLVYCIKVIIENKRQFSVKMGYIIGWGAEVMNPINELVEIIKTSKHQT